MTKFSVVIADSAVKELKILDAKLTERIKISLRGLEEDPFRKRPKADIKKLHGLKDPVLYRLRIGDYRIIYAVEGKNVRITHILKRSDAYKVLD